MSHVRRHSLATILLQENVKLPVISEILGHDNTDSTSYYLRIDLQSLRKCVLDVPPVCESFYAQKGGYFYE
ncbi:MAG: tyrosine-type recombinase/integrase [Prevotella sp.]|nr:tyrosine-type recombinase/integrase [Prevotella sp.]